MSEACHSMKAVVRRTGLSAHVIRVWEKRYGAVKPHRTDGNRRLYSDEDVERLILFREITRGGHNIGAIANLSLDKLRKIAPTEAAAPQKPTSSTHAALLKQCVGAINQLDAGALESALNRGSVELGGQGLLQKVIAPLAEEIGELWREGEITAAHEHFASAVIRVFLGQALRSFTVAEGAPGLVVGTPSGQMHELGALLAGAAAANIGWHVTYLGAGLPAAEIAGAAQQSRARAVALSVVYPEDDPKLEGELLRVRELLPPKLPLLVGGRAAPAYRATLSKVGALEFGDLGSFCSELDRLRNASSRHRR